MTQAPGPRLQRGYTGLALLVLNTCLLFALLNLLLAGLFAARAAWREHQRDAHDVVAAYGPEKAAQAFPGWSREDLLTLQRETRASLLMEYEPFTEFRPPVVQGRFVNVSAPGFRLVPDQGPWPPDPAAFAIFV